MGRDARVAANGVAGVRAAQLPARQAHLISGGPGGRRSPGGVRGGTPTGEGANTAREPLALQGMGRDGEKAGTCGSPANVDGNRVRSVVCHAFVDRVCRRRRGRRVAHVQQTPDACAVCACSRHARPAVRGEGRDWGEGMSPKRTVKPGARFAFKEQKIMRRVLFALCPALLGSVFFFGWRALFLCVWVCFCGACTEYAFARGRGDPLTESCLVTCLLLALSLPPTLPFWMAAVGATVALAFGKEVFGGFGRNVFNPAIVGRGFLYVCFPLAMTGRFAPAWRGGAGGFVHWSARTSDAGINALSAATPMLARRDYGHEAALLRLFVGDIGTRFTGSDAVPRVLGAGSMGEVSVLLVLLGGAYLLWTKTANWRLVVSSLGGALAAGLVFRHLLGAEAVPAAPWLLCSGGLLYACFFMVTDPVSAPNDRRAQVLYGACIGAFIVLFRWRAVFAGGVGFAILLGNTLGPTIEMGVKALTRRRTRPAQSEDG